MDKLSKLKVRRSEIRQRLNELGSKEELTDEEIQEADRLSAEYQTAETRHRALTIAADKEAAGDDTTGEGSEVRKLETRANLGVLVERVIEHHGQEGAEKELQAAYKLAGNQFPVEMLRRRETRAAASAQAPAEVGQQQQAISPVVFPGSVMDFMGVEMPTVNAGEPVYPVMTAPTDHAAAVAEGAEVDDTTATFSADVLSPKRVQRSITYSREDAAVFSMMDEAIRQNLSDSISDGLEYMMLRTTDEGILDFGVDPTAPGSVSTFADYRDAIFNAIDGRYASVPSDARMLVGASTLAHMGTRYRANSADDSAYDSVRNLSGGLRVSAHVPAAASEVQQAVVARATGMRHAVMPIWSNVTLSDPYTDSKSGNIRLTIIALANFKIVRTAGFIRTSFKLA